MKRLTLIRHAKSSWKNADLPDFERPLNKRGERDAPMMGRRLAARQVQPDLIVSSPARRAISTAMTIAEEIGFPVDDIVTEQAIYEADVPDLLGVIRALDDAHDEVMLFGHNPGLADLSVYLTAEHLEKLPTCAVMSIDFNIDAWDDVAEGSGARAFFDYPKNPDA